ncbi:unnamed protein product, partial [Closterium sp. Naga37s-1]
LHLAGSSRVSRLPYLPRRAQLLASCAFPCEPVAAHGSDRGGLAAAASHTS